MPKVSLGGPIAISLATWVFATAGFGQTDPAFVVAPPAQVGSSPD